jgi:hypothetical protein
MTNIEEQTIPTAYSRKVNVDSTLKYMGEVITLLPKGTETRHGAPTSHPRAGTRAILRA